MDQSITDCIYLGLFDLIYNDKEFRSRFSVTVICLYLDYLVDSIDKLKVK